MASGSKFAAHIKTWVFVIPFFMVFIVPFFSIEWTYMITSEEIETNKKVFGDERHAQLVEIVDEKFADWFVHNGLYGKTMGKGRLVDELDISKLTNSFLGSYFDHMWKMVYRATYRMYIAWQWLLGGLILIIAFMYDGWQARNIKKHSVSTANPVAIHLVLHSTFFLLGSSVAFLFFPYAITPFAWAIGILATALCAWKLAESYQSTS